MSTNKELLSRDGYVQFPSVMPDELRLRCIAEINTYSDQNFYWSSALADEFREWFRNFLASANLDIWGEAVFGIFNRPNGSYMCWHCDSAGGDVNYGRRVFCCVYMTATDSSNGALKIISKSHLDTWRHSAEMKQQLAQFVKCQSIEAFPNLHPDVHKDDEITLEMSAGTVIVADERLWHAVCVNKTNERRTMVMWWRWVPITNPND